MKNIKEFMEQINFPKEAINALYEVYARIKTDESVSKIFDGICDMYMTDIENIVGLTNDKIKELAEKINVNSYSLFMVLLVICGQKLEIIYKEKGIDDSVFNKSIDDLRCKLIECFECEGVWGTFVDWFHPFYVLQRFGLGRFQFDLNTLNEDYTMPNGEIIPKGILSLGMHIPSSGIPLTDEIRYDSYKKAYEFFKDRHYNGWLVIECGSWLFYPKHREFLPEKSNILKFMDDFHFTSTREKEGFNDIWRIFAGYQNLPYDQLPEDNSLRRAYKKHLVETGKSGSGHGFIVFDGEKIVNK